MADWPELTLKADMPIQLGADLSLRVRRGERVVVVQKVPLDMFDGMSERQCQRNHGQTLAGIRSRAGFDACEALAVLSGQRAGVTISLGEEAAHRILYSMIAHFNRGQRIAERNAAVGRGLSEDRLFELLAAWDEVSAAIDRIVVCQPAGMTAAAEMLEAQRKSMRGVINTVTRQPTGTVE